MPTPFTHLEIARRLQKDSQITARALHMIHDESPAFLLGNIAADARVNTNTGRYATHFYNYNAPITEHPWQIMIRQNPELAAPHSPSHRAFLAGYVSHLAADEFWSLYMLKPQFVEKEWNRPHSFRFLALHLLLIYMDRRDYKLLDKNQADNLQKASPRQWLPFMPDKTLQNWRDFISEQLPPEGQSKTLAIFGERVRKTPGELQQILDSPGEMQTYVWDHVPYPILREIELRMYSFVREQMQCFLNLSYPTDRGKAVF